MSGKNAVVIDNGTGFTKMGYAGNLDPDFVFPTAIADLAKKSNLSVSTKNDEYNYYIGDEALRIQSESNNHVTYYPMQNGIVENWDMMENHRKTGRMLRKFSLKRSMNLDYISECRRSSL